MEAASLAPIVDAILRGQHSHPVRVGIDGFCAAGKTTLADSLALELRAVGRGVIRACTDDFQNPPEVRPWASSGTKSTSNRFEHSCLTRSAQAALGVFIRPRTDVHASRTNLSVERFANSTDVLLLDGLFLHAPAVVACFDLTIFVSTDYETCLARALARNQERASDRDELQGVYRESYIPGFELYCQEAAPEQAASFIVKT